MSNKIAESLQSIIPFTIDDYFAFGMLVILVYCGIACFVYWAKFIEYVNKDIKDFFNEKSNRKNKSRK